MRDFRNEKVTAPLKDKAVYVPAVFSANFRNEKVTAPLKGVFSPPLPFVAR